MDRHGVFGRPRVAGGDGVVNRLVVGLQPGPVLRPGQVREPGFEEPPEQIQDHLPEDRVARRPGDGGMEVESLLRRLEDKDRWVAELGRHLAGQTTLEDAALAAKQATRNFAKRQLTWLRNQVAADCVIEASYGPKGRDKALSFVGEFLAAGG